MSTDDTLPCHALQPTQSHGKASQKYVKKPLFVRIQDSVVILALNPRKFGQIANKGFMIYYGKFRSQLKILKSPKQNSCSNLLN